MKDQVTLTSNDNASSVVLYMAIELSKKTWKLAFSDGVKRRQVTIEARNLDQLSEAIAKAREKFRLPPETPVRSCFEAGRDGFWLHRYLESQGIGNLVVDSASIEVNRRSRRAKTDRIDASKLLRMLQRYWGGEKQVWSVVRVPSEEEEDARRLHRELERLKKERGQHTTRIKSLLMLHGVALEVVGGADWAAQVAALQQWNGEPLGEDLRQELVREGVRLELVREQIRRLEQEQKRRIRESADPMVRKVAQLMELKAIGLCSAWVFVMEFYGWRRFTNRRQIGGLAGLTGTPYDSGEEVREQGISKAGNRRIRAMILEISWLWLRYQPGSRLSQWFNRRYAGGNKRMRRIGIVALARQLLVELWRYLDFGVIPEGARLQAA